MLSKKSLKCHVGHIGHHGIFDCGCAFVVVEDDFHGSDGCHKMKVNV